MWIVLALLSGAFATGENLLARHTLRANRDVWAFSLLYSLVGAVITLPFMFYHLALPQTLGPWLLAAFVALLIVGNNYLLFKATGQLEASLVGSLLKLRLVWVFILGIVLLRDPFSWTKLAGTVMTLLAGWVIVHGFKRPRSLVAVMLVLAATVFNATLIILSKYLLGSFSVGALTFIGFFLMPLLINAVAMPRVAGRVKALYRLDGRMVLLACGLGALVNLALIGALALRDASSVIIITEVFLILVLVGEHIWLKEKEYVWVKLASVGLAVAGAILIQV
jgi:drug/metabolite transporter (DMT)-like permease